LPLGGQDLYRSYFEKTSPTPTTGAALYALGSVPDTYVLFREVQGHRDDELAPKTEAPIHLTEWEHFYSAQGKLNPGDSHSGHTDWPALLWPG
jgi:hypothetical protein